MKLSEDMIANIHVALGEASMCWKPRPSDQEFDSSKAKEIAMRVVQALEGELKQHCADLSEPELVALRNAAKVKERKMLADLLPGLRYAVNRLRDRGQFYEAAAIERDIAMIEAGKIPPFLEQDAEGGE